LSPVEIGVVKQKLAKRCLSAEVAAKDLTERALAVAERVRRHREKVRMRREIVERYLGRPTSPDEKRDLVKRWGWRLGDD
jgi:hypothetical protein